MAARLIHLGFDEAYPLKVLRRAGYDVHVCSNLIEFRTALQSNPLADAVLFNDGDGSLPPTVFSLARSRSTAPIILFPKLDRVYRPEDVDLVVPRFTPSEEWLLDLANLIVRARALRAYSQLLQEHSEAFCRDPGVAGENSRNEIDQSRRERVRSAGLLRRNLSDRLPD